MTASHQPPCIDYHEDNGVAWITLNRANKLNSFNAEMLAQLRDTLNTSITTQHIRCLVITGAGRGFCTGQDLSALDPDNLGAILEDGFNPIIRTIKAMNIPVIACVNGVAAGAGANLALACDIVIAGESAKFIQSFSHIGLVPDAGGTWHLPKLVGLPRAMAIAMTGEAVSASKAEKWGMIWQAVDDDKLMKKTSALAHQLANQATTGLAFTKQLLHTSYTNTLDEQLNLERDFQKAASQTQDFKEGVDAFLSKRSAKFTGQ